MTAYWRQFIDGFLFLANWTTTLQAVLYSVITWGLSVLAYWCVLQAFEPKSTFVEAAFMVVSLSLAVTVPSSPGFIGVFQYVGQQALVLPFAGKYSASSAFAIVLTAYLTYYLLTSSLGIIAMLRLRQSFKNLGRKITTGLGIRKNGQG